MAISKQSTGKISWLELCFYFIIFISSLSYGVFDIAVLSQAIADKPELGHNYLDIGSIFGRLKDVKDSEWRAFESTFLSLLLIYLGNAAVTWILILCGYPSYRKFSILLFGSGALVLICGPFNTTVIFAYGSVAYVGMKIFHPWAFGWLLGVAIMYHPFEFQRGSESLWPSHANVFARLYSFWHLAWNVMRFISFGSEWQWRNKSKEVVSYSLIDFLCYILYPPTLFGPLISYPHFHEQVLSSTSCEKFSANFSLKVLLKKSLEVFAWGFLLLASMELIYINVINADLNLVRSLNGWGAAAFTWAYGQYFQAKYMVLYGIPWLAAYFDGGVRLLPLPIFVSRVYCYSDMWKHFDTGLFDFVKRYIFIPLGGSKDYLLSTAGVFTFIFVWHGLSKSIAMWTAANFFQVICEKYIRKWANDPTSVIYRTIRCKVSHEVWRRLTGLACALSFQISVAAISIFLLGQETGMAISLRTILNTNINYFVHLVVAYCWVQCVFSWEIRTLPSLEPITSPHKN